MENWKEAKNELSKTYNFKDFVETVDFVTKIRDVAEAYNHHPDLYIHSYNKVKVMLTTHSEGRVTEKDYKLAEEIDNLDYS